MKGIHFFLSPLARKFPQWSFWNRIEPPVIEGPLGLKAQFSLGWRCYKQWEINGDIRCISASRYSTAKERMSLGALPQKQFFRKTTVVLPDNVDSGNLAEALLTEMKIPPQKCTNSILKRALEIIKKNFTEHLSLQELADRSATDKAHLCRVFYPV